MINLVTFLHLEVFSFLDTSLSQIWNLGVQFTGFFEFFDFSERVHFS